jgi:hypothetical protein
MAQFGKHSRNVHTLIMPDGSTVTRMSKPTIEYTHALVGKHTAGANPTGNWDVLGFTRKPKQSCVAQWNWHTEKHYRPVTVAHVMV